MGSPPNRFVGVASLLNHFVGVACLVGVVSNSQNTRERESLLSSFVSFERYSPSHGDLRDHFRRRGGPQDSPSLRRQFSAREALQTMDQLRRNSELTDVELVADSQVFRAHRVVLAASSMYFRAMFTRQMAESGQRRIVIQGVEPAALSSLIKFSYTCVLEINEENAQSLLAASNFLQMLHAGEACCQFLKDRLDTVNCLDVADFAEFQSCQDLLDAALTYCRRHFTDVSRGERFVLISYNRMKHFLSSNDLLLSEGEESVFNALVRWVRHNVSERSVHFYELLDHIKLPLLGQEFFAVEVAANPLVSSNEHCMKLIREAARALYNDSYPNNLSHLSRLPTQIPMKWWPRDTLRAGEVIHILGQCA